MRVLLVSLLLSSLLAGNGSAARRACTRQMEIANGVIAANEFRKARDLAQYLSRFGDPLMALLVSLGDRDHVMDAGSGETVAVAEYLGLEEPAASDERVVDLFQRRRGIANVTAVTFALSELRETFLRPQRRKLNLKSGEYFERLSRGDLTDRFGKMAAIIDFWGVLAYTASPSEALRSMVASLRPGGRIFMAIGPREYDYISGFGRPKSKSSVYRSTVRLRSGNTITFPDWLRTIRGLVIHEDGENFIIAVPDPSRVVVPDSYLEDIDETVTHPPARLLVESQ